MGDDNHWWDDVVNTVTGAAEGSVLGPLGTLAGGIAGGDNIAAGVGAVKSALNPKPPAPKAPAPAPTPDNPDTANKMNKAAEEESQRSTRGIASTMLTGGQGLLDPPTIARSLLTGY